jgi:transposase
MPIGLWPIPRRDVSEADRAGFNRLYEPGRQPGPILEAACWAHARRKLYELAAVAKAPIATETVQRIDRLFAVEHDIAGLSPEARLAARTERSAPILAELEPWLRHQLERLSRRSEVGKAIAYTTKRWATLTRFMQDGRICLSNNAAERALIASCRAGSAPGRLSALGPARRRTHRPDRPSRGLTLP